MKRFLVLLLIANSIANHGSNGWSFWPFSSEKTSSTSQETGGHLIKSPVPFEMTDAEETFLAEAQKYMGKMKPLDSCHQIVINRIKKSCSAINEEELAKLGVQLLNCQSLAEHRKTYECTDQMSIAECTSNMDSETWNSYHIISNRARSVCYATRQQQFRLKTEYAVNQLGKQAEDQLNLMDSLKTGQSKLVDLATDTVDKITAGQKVIVSQQRRIHLTQVSNQRTIENHVNKNIQTLSRENSLIDRNHAQLTSMTHSINNKLETATNLLKKQEKNLKDSHVDILHDLNDIRVKAQDVWSKLNDSASHMLQNRKESADHYKDTIENLMRINKTISYLLEAIQSTQSQLDDRITWLASQFGATGYQISTMVTIVMHAGYFLVATYGIVFVQAPVVTRVTVVLVVPGNALCQINHGWSMTFSQLTAVLVTVLVGNWLYLHFKRQIQIQPLATPKNDVSPLKLRHKFTADPCKTPCSVTPCRLSPLSSTFNSTMIPKIPSHDSATSGSISPSSDAKRKLELSSIIDTTSTTLKTNLPSTPGRGPSTPSKRCNGITRTGKKCKKLTSNENTFCSIHDISRA